MVPQAGNRRALLERGDADISYDLPNKDFVELKGDGKLDIVSTPYSNGIQYIGMNVKNPPFDNLKVRQAVAYAIPYQKIMDAVLFGLAKPMFGAPAGQPTEVAWPQATKFNTDIAKAKALLAEAGYPNGFETTLSFDLGFAGVNEPLCVLVQESLAQIGIKTTINKIPGANWRTELNKKVLPLYTNVFSGWLDYPEYFFIWCYDGKNSIFNTMSYQSKAMDDLITIYGVWGKSAEDFYAVGSAGGRNGFVWHYHGGGFERETIPLDLPRLAGSELPGFFKVFGLGDDVWVVGAAGAILHRSGSAPFAVVPTTTRDTLFTVHAVGDRVVAVGGAGNGVLLEGAGGSFHDASPPSAGLIQGIFTTDRGDWASGERGVVYNRPQPGGGAFAAVDHGLMLPTVSSLHSIFVDDSGGVWSAGGNVLSPALDDGMLVHYGDRVPPVVIEEDDAKPDAAPVAVCPAAVVAAGKNGSIGRRWDEQTLAAIRVDLPRPPIHARNLYHVSAAMWDAWAGYDARATGVFVRERHTAGDVEHARRAAISYAAYGVLTHRYRSAVGGARTMACLRAVMQDLGYDPTMRMTPATTRSPSGTASRMRCSRRRRTTARTKPKTTRTPPATRI